MRKNYVFIILFYLLIVYSCQFPSGGGNYFQIHGFTQGTTYNITYGVSDSINYQHDIDSILRNFDMSLSSYEPNSIISRINKNDPDVLTDEHFNVVFRKSEEVFKESDGLFDITVMPLVNAWGFGPGRKVQVDKKLIDSLLQFVGMGKVKLIDNKVVKSDPRVQLDVNAIAQGYSVDVVSDFFHSKGITNYLVEIGGELKAKGKNPKGQAWRVGIDRPEFGNMIPGDQLQAILLVNDRAVSTSGNYRKYYEENGVKITHHINPKTGYPEHQSILSVTIIADDCITADAYGTVFMVSGLEKTKKILKKHKELEAYVIYGDEAGLYQVYSTSGLKAMISE